MVRPFDLIDELEKAGQDYLFILSPPETQARASAPYTYQIEVKSKAAGVRYKLEKAPEAMTVSAGGKVSWQVPQSMAGSTVPVIVAVRNAARKEVFHAFEIVVE